jgi:hypothetical protein
MIRDFHKISITNECGDCKISKKSKMIKQRNKSNPTHEKTNSFAPVVRCVKRKMIFTNNNNLTSRNELPIARTRRFLRVWGRTNTSLHSESAS